MPLARFLELSTDPEYVRVANLQYWVDAAMSESITFFFLTLPWEKICKSGDELEEVMEGRNVIEFSKDILELCLMIYCNDPKGSICQKQRVQMFSEKWNTANFKCSE